MEYTYAAWVVLPHKEPGTRPMLGEVLERADV